MKLFLTIYFSAVTLLLASSGWAQSSFESNEDLNRNLGRPISGQSNTAAKIQSELSKNIPISNILFTGQTVFTSEQLRSIMNLPLPGRFDLKTINSSVDAITQHYHSQGFHQARAEFKPQGIYGGEITVTITEGDDSSPNNAKNITEIKNAPKEASQSLIPIQKLRFTGQTVYTTEQLSDFLGLAVPGYYDLQTIQAAVDSLSNHYRMDGYSVARAWLMPQAMTGGELTITIFEGHLSTKEPFKISTNDPRVRVDLVRDALSQNLCTESISACSREVITEDRIDRATLLAIEITGYQLAAELSPGQEIGTSTLLVQASSRTNYAGGFTIDNFGSQATGVNRGTFSLALNDLLDQGDLLYMSYVGTNLSDMHNFSADYSDSVGFNGLRLGATVARTQYVIQGPGYVGLGFAGTARTASAYASYPLARTATSSVDLRGTYEFDSLHDFSADEEDRNINSYRLGLSGDFRDEALLGLPSSSVWSLIAASSNLILNGSASNDVAERGYRTKTSVRFERNQSVAENGWFFDSLMYGQRASGNLDSFAKLFLGGASSVRAYPSGETGGDSAAIGQFSLGKNWQVSSDTVQRSIGLSTFYDRGWAMLQQSPAPGISDNTQTRAGWGLETNWFQKDLFTLRLFWAKATTGPSEVDSKIHRVGASFGLNF